MNEIEQLIYIFSKLPGLGPRSARRIVLHLLEQKEVRIQSLLNKLSSVLEKVEACSTCYNIDFGKSCHICASDTRDNSTIAIVENVADLWAMERSSVFNGKYHVLGNNLSATHKYTPDHLRLPELLLRCKTSGVEEIIIATNSTLDGQTTAYFITDYFTPHKIKISRLASGIPVGGELDYLDEGTLSAAINSRQPF